MNQRRKLIAYFSRNEADTPKYTSKMESDGCFILENLRK